MQGGKHQVSGERCLNRYLRGFGVTNFADHDDVRILAQDGAQSPGERHIHPAVYLGLSDAFQLVLDGIFDGQDITLGGIQLGENCIQRGAFSRPRRAGDENDAVRLLY